MAAIGGVWGAKPPQLGSGVFGGHQPTNTMKWCLTLFTRGIYQLKVAVIETVECWPAAYGNVIISARSIWKCYYFRAGHLGSRVEALGIGAGRSKKCWYLGCRAKLQVAETSSVQVLLLGTSLAPHAIYKAQPISGNSEYLTNKGPITCVDKGLRCA